MTAKIGINEHVCVLFVTFLFVWNSNCEVGGREAVVILYSNLV